MTVTKKPRRLVIVESPAKGKTIEGYLGDGFVVEASIGHIRDLPRPSELPEELKKGPYSKFAVNVEDDFTPFYVINSDKKKKVSELAHALKDADELYLATDGDREGEAIAWHLSEVLQPKIPVYRLVFPEITKEAIERAMNNLRDIDMTLVDAQETRRILDRIYGYEVSPVLWRKVKPELSAGRVQSVATRLVVDRERERMAFRAASYWDLTVTAERLAPGAESFKAKLSALNGQKIASGKDFNDEGVLTARNAVHLDKERAESLATGLKNADFTVSAVESKPYTRRPQAPFTTSTLQQAAASRLRLTSRTTMRVAQNLYENGYITYMRTDSTHLSEQAVQAARQQAQELYGTNSIPGKPRTYVTKAMNAQEAHEAIRPSGDSFRTPKHVAGELAGDEFRLYELIWKRTVASQMEDVKGLTSTVKLSAKSLQGSESGSDAEFSVSGTVITSMGFLAAYEDADSGDRAVKGTRNKGKDSEKRLPELSQGEKVTAVGIAAQGHDTTPPPRYTEASLIKQLEDLGIGRPSTFAATVSTIMDRGYVSLNGGALAPSWLAFSVIRLLEEHFNHLIDYQFTAVMEEDLDRIARGEQSRVRWLNEFYYGDSAEAEHPGLRDLVDNLGEIDAKEINSIPITDDIVVRVGRYGPYLEGKLPEGAAEGSEPPRANIPADILPDSLTPEVARQLMEKATQGDRELGADPDSNHTIVVKDGRFGPYVTEIIPEAADDDGSGSASKTAKKKEKPRTAALFKTMDYHTVTLDDALKLMSLPRIVGTDSEGVEITSQNGRFGPYLKKGNDSRSLESEEQIFSVTLEEAQKIYDKPKVRGRRAAAPPLREFGEDPATGKQLVAKEGRYGAYITDGETNATIPRGQSIEALTHEQAIALISEKRAKGPSKRKPAAKKTAAKKKTVNK